MSASDDHSLMQAQNQAESPHPTGPRKLLTRPVILATVFTVELFLSRFLPEAETMHYSWAGNFWVPSPIEIGLYTLMNLAIAIAAGRLLTSDLAVRLSLRARRWAMLGSLCAAGFFGAQALYGWVVSFGEVRHGWMGEPGLTGNLAHVVVVFQAACALATMCWMSARLSGLGRGREARRANMATAALLVALGARALTFGTGTTTPAAALIVGLTAMLYVIYQLTWLGRPTDLLLEDPVEVKAAPQL